MKIKILPLLVVGVFATALFFSSCLNTDVEEIVYPAESSITSFSIGTVNIERHAKDSLGKDTTYTDTIYCGHYPFTIDQLKRTIENKDSLPMGSDVSRVLASIKADTRAIVYAKKNEKGELKDTIWNETDSIDFTHPVTFKVYALNGMEGLPYMVTVNVHKQNPDTLEWSHVAAPKFASGKLNRQKTMCINDALFTMGTKVDGTPVIETLAMNHAERNEWKLVSTLPEHTNTYSFQAWNNRLYFVADGKLYTINKDEEANIQQVGQLDNLLSLIGKGNIAANQEVLFAYNAEYKMVALTENGTMAIDHQFEFEENKVLDTPRLSSVSIPTRHNKSLTRTIVMGNSAPTDSICSVFGYTTNDDKWSVITTNEDGACPNMENISMINYDNKLYAFGGGVPSKEIKPFESFYSSKDNGLTWQKVTSQMIFPQEESSKHPDVLPFANYYTAGVDGSYSTVVDANHFIWIVWENGNVTKGRLNRLGFAPKW